MNRSEGILRRGQIVRTESSGSQWKVGDLLGAGGQGEVYRAASGKNFVALKWYFPASATPRQRVVLEALVRTGPPTENFLWPQELASSPGTPGFGYVMPLRETRYRSIVDLMLRRIEPGFRALTTSGLNLAHNYLQLHSQGMCYRDISFGNVFFDPNSGEVLICDNDNVTVNGSRESGVVGTPRFMASTKCFVASSGQWRKRTSMTIASALSSCSGELRLCWLFGSMVPSAASEKSTVHLNP